MQQKINNTHTHIDKHTFTLLITPAAISFRVAGPNEMATKIVQSFAFSDFCFKLNMLQGNAKLN